MTGSARVQKVLLVSGLQVHPTLSGGNLRTYSLVNALAHHGKDVEVFSFVGRKDEYLARRPSAVQAWEGGVEEYVDRALPGFLAGYGSYFLNLPPLWLTAYLSGVAVSGFSFALARRLRDRLAWCDAVIADFPFVHPIFRAKEAEGRLRVLNLHNVEHHLYAPEDGLRSRLLRRFVRGTELSAARGADVVVSCSEQDKQYFEANVPMRESILVPNGIDVARFRSSEAVRSATRAELGIGDDVKLFLFTASKWGPNSEAFEYLTAFAIEHEAELVQRGIHILVVGSVVDEPVRLPAMTATGRVDAVEPYFAAADAALNPIATGAGTNVKMGEFMAAHLPILVSTFGSRGYRVEHGKSGFVFERDALMPCLAEVRRLFAEAPAMLERMSHQALADNRQSVDMNHCVEPLMRLMDGD